MIALAGISAVSRTVLPRSGRIWAELDLEWQVDALVPPVCATNARGAPSEVVAEVQRLAAPQP